MSIYVMADLHLSNSTNKPMGVFGSRWTDHMDKIKKNWSAIINDDDTVIVEFGNNKNCRIPMKKEAIIEVENAE